MANQDPDAMHPQQDPEQVQLWQTINSRVTPEMIERDIRFWNLPEELARHLASLGISQAIERISKKYQLEPRQTEGIAHIIKLIALGDVHHESIMAALHKLGVDVGRARTLWDELTSVVLKPIEKYLPVPIKNMLKQPAIERQTFPPAASLKKEPEQRPSGNIVNLRENNSNPHDSR